MSADRIAKLEGLLARITLRASQPRAAAAAGAVALAAAPAAPPAPRRVQTPPPMRAAAASSPDVTVEEGEDYIDESEVDGSGEVVSVDVDEPLAHTDEVAVPHVPSTDMDDEAPVSSKRPIAEDEQAEDEAAPRHTPPPESGRQIAAGPAGPPESARRPSRPPARDEGPIGGGWREPGLAQPKPPTAAAPPPPPPPPVSAARPIGGPPPAVPGAAPAQVMRPQLAPTGDVARIEGQVAQAEPSSFGELLDDSLDL